GTASRRTGFPSSGGETAQWRYEGRVGSIPQFALGGRLPLSEVGRARRHAHARGVHGYGGICRHRGCRRMPTVCVRRAVSEGRDVGGVPTVTIGVHSQWRHTRLQLDATQRARLLDALPPGAGKTVAPSAQGTARGVVRLLGRPSVRTRLAQALRHGERQLPHLLGERAEFSGVVRNDRLTGVARYPDGATCEFSATIAFGIGEPEPNTFTCRKPSGEVMSEGALRVQLIRLKGCTRRPRSPS